MSGLKTNIPKAKKQIDSCDHVVFIGSCFSEHLSKSMRDLGLHVSADQIGTLFHPFSISKVLRLAMTESSDDAIFQKEDVFLSWNFPSTLYALDEQSLRTSIDQALKNLHTSLRQANYLFITFGTDFYYFHQQEQIKVANCHKVPATEFEKRLASVHEVYEDYTLLLQELKIFNPALEIVFTVSPVRHGKDGLVENNRSKARLLEVIHSLVDAKLAQYFPAYEIILDELRDYRFFEADFVHPNTEAIRYVWNRFVATYFSEANLQLMEEVNQYLSAKNHRIMHKGSAAARKHEAHCEQLQTALKIKYPQLNWRYL